MLTPEQIQHVKPKLRLLQLIALMLTMGIVFFVLVASFVTPWKQVAMNVSMLPLLGAAASLFLFLLAFLVPALTASNVTAAAVDKASGDGLSLKQADAAASVLMTGRMIRMALLEASCFLNLVIFIVDHSLVSLVAAGLGLFLMIVTFPLSGSQHSWIADKIRDL